jgi:antirestriction protein
MTKTTTTPQLYVGTYAKYNSGSIAGEWVDLTQFSDADEFLQHCAEIHKDEEDPEFMFQDYEGFPKSFYSESANSKDIESLFNFLSMDEDERKLVEMYADATGYSVDECTLDAANDAFHGTADSEADFAEQTAEDTGAIPKDIPSWIVIDWEATWKCNLRYDYNTATDEDGTIYFFYNS